MENKHERILVSACLLGVRCRYDGEHQFHPALEGLQQSAQLIPVCPEQLGGLPTPRPPAQIEQGDGTDVLAGKARVVTLEGGCDVTEQFLRGAEGTLELARFYGAKRAILKSRSPSCGCGAIVREGVEVPGDGVTAALLKEHGIMVSSSDGLPETP